MTFKPAVSEAEGRCVSVYVCVLERELQCCLVTLSKAPCSTWSACMCVFLSVTQRRNGEDIPVAQTKNINHRRFAASFHLKEVTNQDQDLYRCVTQSERGSGVSNFAGLIVRGEDFKTYFSRLFDCFVANSVTLVSSCFLLWFNIWYLSFLKFF